MAQSISRQVSSALLSLASSLVPAVARAQSAFSIAVTKFVPMLRQRGVKDDVLQRILADNPRRFLAFVPKNAS